jgi:hypothetical protein
MAISDNYAPIKQLGNGSTTIFTGSWKVFNASYMRVYLEDNTTNVQTLQVLGVDYTLTFNEAGFTVTMIVAPPSTKSIIMAREIPLNQTEPYKTAKGFQGETLENSLDKAVAISQNLEDDIGRSLKFPLASGFTDFPLPVPAANRALKFNSDATALINTTYDPDTAGDLSGAAAAAIAAADAANASAIAAANNAASAGAAYGVVTGTANALVLTTGGSVTLATGKRVTGFFAANNTTAVTLNVDGTGDKAFEKHNGVALALGDCLTGAVFEAEYNGTKWLMISTPALTNIEHGGSGAKTVAGARSNFQIGKRAPTTAIATTVQLGSLDGDVVLFTAGTGTLNSFGTTGAVDGMTKFLEFPAGVTLTASATLVLNNNGASYTTAAGDIAIATYNATGTLWNLAIIKADGKALVSNSYILATAQNTTSGTFKDFTGIPSTVNRIRFSFSNVSTNGSSQVVVRLGDSGGIENTGYRHSATLVSSGVASAFFTSGFAIYDNGANAGSTRQGSLDLDRVSGNLWVCKGISGVGSAATVYFAGDKTLSDVLTQIRITTENGTDTFDLGSVNISYE